MKGEPDLITAFDSSDFIIRNIQDFCVIGENFFNIRRTYETHWKIRNTVYRTFATQLGISVRTVENAYDQLADEGYIRSVPEKGYYAKKVEKNIRTVAGRELPCKVRSDENDDTENELFLFTVRAKLMREELSGNQRKLLTKPLSEGVYELRNAISEHLKRFRNIKVTPEQIMIGAETEYLYMLIDLLFGNNYISEWKSRGIPK